MEDEKDEDRNEREYIGLKYFSMVVMYCAYRGHTMPGFVF
jgi:hypothetical protein